MGMPLDFEWSYTDEPHATRRKLIMAKYPEVQDLFGPHWITKYIIVATVVLQMCIASQVSSLSWPVLVALAYTIGGVCNHSLTLAMHEVSHNLAFKFKSSDFVARLAKSCFNLGTARLTLWTNKLFGLITNLPLGIPAFIQFKRYHRDHHKYQGENDVDTDMPTVAEGRIFVNAFMKIVWMFLQPAFYALRPQFTVPKTPGIWELINWVIVFGLFDYTIYTMWGIKAVAYLILGTLLGMGLHPMAGHFVAEHYTFVKGQETYSYYGPLNWFSYNVGYHNEHHDFPNIAGFNLPKLRALAPEFYDTLPHHSSWSKVVWQYIVDPDVGPFSRIKRATLEDDVVKRVRAG